MNFISKVLIPNKEWIIEDQGEKIGSIAKVKKVYSFLRNGKKIDFKDLNEITKEIGVTLSTEKKITKFEINVDV
jgi:hypothetical protein